MFRVTGNTYPHRKDLHDLGLRWEASSKSWTTEDRAIFEAGRALVNGSSRNNPSTPKPPTEDIRIEYPSRGATYCRNEYGVYRYDEFPRSSVLAGQQRRQFLASYPTLDEAKSNYPAAQECGCGYQKPYLGHLPGEDDPEPW